MKTVVAKRLILYLVAAGAILYPACTPQAPLTVGNDSAGQQSSQAVGTGMPKIEQGTAVKPVDAGPASSQKQKAGSPVIDKFEVVLRSNQDVNVIEIDPNSDEPQPKIEIKTLYTAEITCKARSISGGPLTYEWQATGGKIYGEGRKITWLAPGAPIVYRITVTVADSEGSASAPVFISARCCY